MKTRDKSHSVSDVDLSVIQYDLYTLLALILADNEIAHLIKHRSSNYWTILVDEKTGKHLIFSSLLRIAATMRYLNDSSLTKKLVKKSPLGDKKCGSLWKYDTTNKKLSALELQPREACNKIIHGDEFLIKPTDTKDSSDNHSSFSSIIFISGYSSNGRRVWESELGKV